jgi:hypothetical protein
MAISNKVPKTEETPFGKQETGGMKEINQYTPKTAMSQWEAQRASQKGSDVFSSSISSTKSSVNVTAVVAFEMPLRVQTPPRLARSRLSADDLPRPSHQPTPLYDRA